MAVVLDDGFETGNFVAWSSTTGGPTVQNSVVLAGSFSACVASGVGNCSFMLDHQQADFYTSFKFRVDLLPTAGNFEDMMATHDGSTGWHWRVLIEPNGTLKLRNNPFAELAAGSTAMSTGVTYTITMSCVKATGRHIVTINGVEQWNTTALGALANDQKWHFYGKAENHASQSVTYYYDDVVVRDDPFPAAGPPGPASIYQLFEA